MGKTDLKYIYTKINGKLWNNLLFFIPNSFFDLDFNSNLGLEKIKGLLYQKILVMDNINDIRHFDHEIDNGKYLEKTSELNEIIFILLEEKSKLKDHELSYIIDKHYEHAECLLYISNWLNSNLEQLNEVDSNLKGLFIIQLNFYKKHLEDFIRNFYPNKTHLPNNRPDILKLIKVNFKEITNTTFINQVLPEKTKDVFTKLFDKKQTDINQKKVKAKKKILVTEEESEKFILRKVFNIDK